jgi:hypothetical protein
VTELPRVPSEEPQDPPLSRLYQATRDQEPTPGLDAAIRARARDHCRRRLPRRWLVPLSTAALVVLGLSLSLRVLDLQPPARETGQARPETAATAPPPRPLLMAPSREVQADRTIPRPPAPAALEAPPRQTAGPAPSPHPGTRWQAGAAGMAPAEEARITPPPARSRAATAAQPSALDRLTHIRALLAQGNVASARLELADFRLYFPREPVPSDILAALARADADGI